MGVSFVLASVFGSEDSGISAWGFVSKACDNDGSDGDVLKDEDFDDSGGFVVAFVIIM